MGLLDREMIRSDTCARAFERMLWAFLFFIDFRIGVNNVHVDVLPDFVGWILMATALGWILGLHSEIKGIRTLSLVAIFVSIFDLIEIKIPTKKVAGMSYPISPSSAINIILIVLGIIVIWKLCRVIMDMAEAVGDSLMKERADFRRKLYVGFVIAMMVAPGICILLPPMVLVIGIVGLIVAIVVFCLMMTLMKATANMCRESAMAPTTTDQEPEAP